MIVLGGEKIRKSFVFILVLIIFLVACSHKSLGRETIQSPLDEINENGNITKREFYTDDHRTKFIIHNDADLHWNTLEEMYQRILEAYNNITTFFQHPEYEWSDTIHIYFGEGNGFGEAFIDKIHYYNVYSDQLQLTHELAHTLLGYGDPSYNHFNRAYGQFTQEGLAVFLNDQFDEEVFYGMSLNSLAKLIIENDNGIPLETLSSSAGALYFGSDDRLKQWKSYVLSGSFTSYLINRYGKEKYQSIYNTADLQVKIKEVYQKQIIQLESDWTEYLAHEVEDLNQQEKEKIQFWYPSLVQ